MEERRRYTETVLEAVATGVVSLDPLGRITTINGAAERMLGLAAARQRRPAAGGGVRAARSTRRSSPWSSAWRGGRERHGGRARCTCAATAQARRRCSPPPPRCAGRTASYMGMVLVFDDLTELLKAQRLAAWREVAQRIAHEIKNPLTPIQLSAQRLRRRLGGDGSADEKRLLEEGTATIIQEVDGLKQLVDEFSRFARMPALVAQAHRPRAGSLEGVVVALPRVASRR